MRLIDADSLPLDKIDDANYGSNFIRIAPTVDAIPRENMDAMVAEIENYSVETKIGKVVLLDKILEILGTQKGT